MATRTPKVVLEAQVGICPAPCVLRQFTVVFAWKCRLLCLCAHGQCLVHHIYHVEFHFRFRHLLSFPVKHQLWSGCPGEKSSKKIPQSGICPAPCVLRQCTVVFAWKYFQLNISCGVAVTVRSHQKEISGKFLRGGEGGMFLRDGQIFKVVFNF